MTHPTRPDLDAIEAKVPFFRDVGAGADFEDQEALIAYIRHLESLPQAPAPADEHAYALNLAVVLARKHWPEITGWKPLPDLMGLLTQIDNMTAGMVRALAPSPDLLEAAPPTIEEMMEQELIAFLERVGQGVTSGSFAEWPQLRPACRYAAKKLRALASTPPPEAAPARPMKLRAEVVPTGLMVAKASGLAEIEQKWAMFPGLAEEIAFRINAFESPARKEADHG